MSNDLLYGEIPIQDLYVKYELVLRRCPSKFIDGHRKISLICVCFLVINVLFLMTICVFQFYTKCDPNMYSQLDELEYILNEELHIVTLIF